MAVPQAMSLEVRNSVGSAIIHQAASGRAASRNAMHVHADGIVHAPPSSVALANPNFTADGPLMAPEPARLAGGRNQANAGLPPPPPYVGAIELDVLNGAPRGVLPGLPQGGNVARAAGRFDWLFNSRTPRPSGSWPVHMLDRNVALRQTPAYLLGQVALLVWDAMSTHGNERTAAALATAFTQLAPAILLFLATPLRRGARPNAFQRGVVGATDVLSLAVYPVGMTLALGAVAALEVSEPKLKRFLQLRLGQTGSGLALKNVMQVIVALGCLALGREIEHATGLQTWFEHIAAAYLATPGDGCQMWIAPKTGVDLFINCVDAETPMTFALTCNAAAASCVAATFGSLNRTRSLPPTQKSFINATLPEVFEAAITNNVATRNVTASWLRDVAQAQFSDDDRCDDWNECYGFNGFGYSFANMQAQGLVRGFVGAPYLAALARDTVISEADMAGTFAAATLRIDDSVVESGFDGLSSYNQLKSMIVALGFRGSVSKALMQVSAGQSLTNTVVNGAQHDVQVDTDGKGIISLEAFLKNMGTPSNCNPAVGNLALQWAGGRVNGKRPADLPPIANLSAFGYDPSVYFRACDAGDAASYYDDSGPDDPHEPLRALAQLVTASKQSQPVNWETWRANLTTALVAKNATAAQAQEIAASWDTLRTYVASLFGNKTWTGSGS